MIKFKESKDSAVNNDSIIVENDMVNNPVHYQSMVKDLNIDAISCMRAAFGDESVIDFCICNALKYIYRHQSKNGKQDIQKAIWYLNKYLELSKD
jgi:tRNA-dihydrouridine synthase